MVLFLESSQTCVSLTGQNSAARRFHPFSQFQGMLEMVHPFPLCMYSCQMQSMAIRLNTHYDHIPVNLQFFHEKVYSQFWMSLTETSTTKNTSPIKMKWWHNTYNKIMYSHIWSSHSTREEEPHLHNVLHSNILPFLLLCSQPHLT